MKAVGEWAIPSCPTGSCAVSDRAWSAPFLDLTHGCRSRLVRRRAGLIAAAADPPAGPGPLTSQPLKLTPWPHTSSCGGISTAHTLGPHVRETSSVCASTPHEHYTPSLSQAAAAATKDSRPLLVDSTAVGGLPPAGSAGPS